MRDIRGKECVPVGIEQLRLDLDLCSPVVVGGALPHQPEVVQYDAQSQDFVAGARGLCRIVDSLPEGARYAPRVAKKRRKRKQTAPPVRQQRDDATPETVARALLRRKRDTV